MMRTRVRATVSGNLHCASVEVGHADDEPAEIIVDGCVIRPDPYAVKLLYCALDAIYGQREEPQ